MLGPSSFSTAHERCAMPFRSGPEMAAAFGISRSMMYFGIDVLRSGGVRLVDHRGYSGGVRAVDVRVPGGEHAARVFLPHPRVEPPEPKRVDMCELLVEQNRRLSAPWHEGVRDDVFHGHQAQSAVLFGLIQQQLRLVYTHGPVDESDVAVVEPHPAGAARIRHARRNWPGPSGVRGAVEPLERCRRLPKRGEIPV